MDDHVALSLGFLKAREIGLNGDVRYLRRLKRSRNEASDTSASTQHNMSVERRACCANRILGCGHAGPPVPNEMLDKRGLLNQHWGQAHGECKGNEDRLTDLGGQQTAVHGHGQQ